MKKHEDGPDPKTRCGHCGKPFEDGQRIVQGETGPAYCSATCGVRAIQARLKKEGAPDRIA